jgi:arylsulfatase A-like enzyme
MRRREFLAAGAAALAGGALGRASAPAAAEAGGQPPERPNILLIMADDVGREVLGCYGGESYETPNIDRLAAGGTRFTYAFSCPVCAPTRVKIMTGRYGFRTTQKWGHIPPEERTFGHVLGDAGYATAIAGKWQMALLKNDPDHVRKTGFQKSCVFGWHEGPRYFGAFVYENGKPVRYPDDVYGPDVYVDFLVDFMKANRDRPFLAYYSMALCHAVSDDFWPPPPTPPGEKRYRSYARCVAAMDERVGRIVQAVEDLGLRERTLVLYTTDNGTPASFIVEAKEVDGKHKYPTEPVTSKWGGRMVRGGKGRMTDLGTRVPLIAHWPGVVPAGRVCDDLIDFSDVFPTLAELAGAAVPDDRPIDGRSFAPQLCGRRGNPRPWAYNQNKDDAWVRTHRWKLYRDGRLFDLEADPDEKKAIGPDGASDEAAAARRRLQAVLDGLK